MNDLDSAKILQSMIDESKKIVFFGGAGVSTESGIPDFRSADGIYSEHYSYPPEEILSNSFFWSHTEEFYRFYREKMLMLHAKPNQAHLKLAEMEKSGILSAVVTQNIDGLHQAAGSEKVYELHGSVHRNYCVKCHRFFDAEWIAKSVGIPHCPCGGIVKPDVVLYEESLDETCIENSLKAISQADLLIVAGTSLRVYPAAGFLRYFRGKYLVVINRDETSADRDASLVIHSSVGEILKQIEIHT